MIAQYTTGSSLWEILKAVSSVQTSLGSYSDAPASSTTRAVAFEVRDATKKLYIDATERISTSNNEITQTGRVHIGCFGATPDSDSAGIHIDNFTATNAITVGRPLRVSRSVLRVR